MLSPATDPFNDLPEFLDYLDYLEFLDDFLCDNYLDCYLDSLSLSYSAKPYLDLPDYLDCLICLDLPVGGSSFIIEFSIGVTDNLEGS